MPMIPLTNDRRTLAIKRFLGLNEDPDGTSALKVGELAEMRNWRITRDYHLQKRPGTKELASLYDALSDYLEGEGETPPAQADVSLRGVWRGSVGGAYHTLAVYGGFVWDVELCGDAAGAIRCLGAAEDEETDFFAFADKVYLLNGKEYLFWDGGAETGFAPVEPYVPTVMINLTPGRDADRGAGAVLVENANRLSGERRVEYAPTTGDDTVDEYLVLPGTAENLQSVAEIVKVERNGETLPDSAWTAQRAQVGGTIGYLSRVKLDAVEIGDIYAVTYRVDDLVTSEEYEIPAAGMDPTDWDGGWYSIVLPEGATGVARAAVSVADNPPLSFDEGESAIRYDPDTRTLGVSGGITDGDERLETSGGSVTVRYRKTPAGAAEVAGMRHAELFNGAADTRVFLYGNGTNKAVYSGIRYDNGQPSAEYFPDLYEMAVGEANTPLTGLVRHYSRMLAFKPNSTWRVTAGTLTLVDGVQTPTFSVQPVNRSIGNEAPGQVKLEENDPLTLDIGGIYQWKSAGGGYITDSETNARRVSERAERTLEEFRLAEVKTVNLRSRQEYWFLAEDGTALIHNYANDTWYVYRDLPFRLAAEVEDEVYGFCGDGRVVRFHEDYRNDCGVTIDCFAATGAMDLGREWVHKYSPMLFVAMQPMSGARVDVTVRSSRKSMYPVKTVAYGLAAFPHVDFQHFSFGTNRQPQVKRLKIKVKKAAYYQIVYESRDLSATATVLSTDVRLRYAGDVK